ncbi:hypothetical protein Q0M94_27980 (plasmid) [Deinococcus radiomollis]|uniref:hypothetical protein n=1 Tax=Deinococcus radiomollis TaxID=468916 RepID=UPI003892C66B
MDSGMGIIEVASASRKAMRIIATSRKDVVSALLTLPELEGDKQKALKIAQIVWDMQGKVDVKVPAVRAQFIETMASQKEIAKPAKPVAAAPHPEAATAIASPVSRAEASPAELVTPPLFAAQK